MHDHYQPPSLYLADLADRLQSIPGPHGPHDVGPVVSATAERVGNMDRLRIQLRPLGFAFTAPADPGPRCDTEIPALAARYIADTLRGLADVIERLGDPSTHQADTLLDLIGEAEFVALVRRAFAGDDASPGRLRGPALRFRRPALDGPGDDVGSFADVDERQDDGTEPGS